MREMRGVPVWQRNYYERIIRNESELASVREYIQNNPAQWGLDDFYVSEA
jgi:REP element-mobilizing transposase RayT